MRVLQSFALLAVLAVPAAAIADPITTLNSTGYGLAYGSSDPNYTLTSVGAGITTEQATVSSPHPAWYQPTSPATTQWLNPDGTGTDLFPSTTYDYTTTFSLAGFDPATAIIFINSLAADDSVCIHLNGTEEECGGTYGSATSLPSITSGFMSGTNTLTFVVDNGGGGATGLYAEISGTADALAPSTVPEPSSMALLGTGILGAAGSARRKFRS